MSLLMPVAAQAQYGTAVAVSGRPLKLNFSTSTNPDCSALGETVVRLTQAPAHGRVIISRARDFPTYPRQNLRSACNARRVAGTRTVYVSERGFVGYDSAAIEIIFPSGNAMRRSYTINVR